MPGLISRRQFLWTQAAAPLLALPPRKLNVLLIAVDDLNNRIACYGDPVVKTPNIDRLGRHGIRFDHAYCQYPLCNPTRTSLLSGRRPDTTRIFDNNTPPRTYLGNELRFMPEYFHDQGYFTARVGKVAHGAFEHQISWDISESAAGRPVPNRGEKKAQRKAAAAGAEGGIKLSWTPTNGTDEDEPDGKTARRIAQIIRENKDKPFFIGCGFHKPHLPWVAPRKYFDMYPPDKVMMPNTPADDRNDIPPIALTHTAGDDEMTELDKRKAVGAYHAATTFMDAQLGVVLDTLDQYKLWDNTIVFLFGDHGWHLNDHLGLWRKMTVFEEAAHAPLIMWAPGKKQADASPRLVEFVDIFPTLVDLCGLPKPPGLEGLSFTPLLSDPQRAWKKAVFTQVRRGRDVMGRSVRTDRYRYTEWDSDGKIAELYDHEKDLHEWTNLAFQKRTPLQEQMAKLLHAGWKAGLP